MTAAGEFVAQIERRNRRLANVAATVIFVAAPIGGFAWSWFGTFGIAVLTLYGLEQLRTSDEVIAGLRELGSEHHTAAAAMESPGVFVPIVVGLIKGIVALAWGLSLAVGLFWIPAVGWFLGAIAVLGALTFPFHAMHEELTRRTVACPRCARTYTLGSQQGCECTACPVYLLRVYGAKDALVVYLDSLPRHDGAQQAGGSRSVVRILLVAERCEEQIR